MRFVVAASSALALGAVVFACSDFGGDETPTSQSDAGPDVVTTDVVVAENEAGPLTEAGPDIFAPPPPFACSGQTFCDDFERDPSDVAGAWTAFVNTGEATQTDTWALQPRPEEPTGTNKAFRLTVGGPVSGKTSHSFLRKDLPSCVGKGVKLDFALRTDGAQRDMNFTVVSLKTADPSTLEYVGIAISGTELIVKSQTRSSDVLQPALKLASTSIPVAGWMSVHLEVDLTGTAPKVSAKFGGTASLSLAARPIEPIVGTLKSCDLTIGADFAGESASPTERWYDDVSVIVPTD